MDILNVLNNLVKRNTNYFFLCSFTFSCLFTSLFVKAQQDFCFTPETSNSAIYQSVLDNAFNNGPFHLKIYVHVIRDNNGNGGQSVQDVEDALAYLDEDFNPHNIYFVWDCEINYIDNSFWFDGPKNNPNGIFSVNNHADGIDIYLFPAIANSIGGLANGVGESSEFWVAGTWDGIPVAQSHIISHEMGHVLFLWHTHHGCEQGGVWENTDGSNCSDAGDFVCDTPADPYIAFDVNENSCDWSGIAYCQPPEPVNQYNPNTNLIMAYTYPGCMEYFTDGQGLRMRNSIATLPYLQNTIISDISCGVVEPCAANNYDAQVFLEFPWLETLVAGYNCEDVTIEVFDFMHYKFLNIAFPASGNVPAEERVYYMDGTFWCKDFPGLDCKAYYGLTNASATTCGCNQSCSGSSCPTLCEQRDKNALLALYQATNGENWNTNWDVNQPMSTWHGLTLDNEGCVKVLNLSNNNLTGTLASEIGTLAELTYVNLANNQISGNIPSTIANLPNVGFLDLRNNQLNGGIPENLSNLPIEAFE